MQWRFSLQVPSGLTVIHVYSSDSRCANRIMLFKDASRVRWKYRMSLLSLCGDRCPKGLFVTYYGSLYILVANAEETVENSASSQLMTNRLESFSMGSNFVG